ncbi:diguanylate cyclase [Pleurocapsales cyanobacterium LEGE 06147]|nr:diguanylate cyclase [Pleurocapsales cyanobacterium LEGE 06147]
MRNNNSERKSLKIVIKAQILSRNNAILNRRLEDYLRQLEQKVQELTISLGQIETRLQEEIEQNQEARATFQRLKQELQNLATIDSLTQIPNRRRFDEYLNQEWDRLTREQEPLSLLLCDVDFFKRYNDTYGHQAGDSCLRIVAQTISRTAKRASDLVARYGGEEFTVILPNTNLSGAIKIAEAIQQQIENLQILHPQSDVSEFVTVSIGVVSQVPTLNDSVENLIAKADRALYLAKAQGRNRVVVAE